MDKKIRNNIRYLAKINNFKLGDLERKCGVQAGYLSRDNNMTVKVFLNFCNNLSVTPNDLIYHDYEEDLLNSEIAELEQRLAELKAKKNEV